jgi:hypothetical protein
MKIINFLFLQWFCVRVDRSRRTKIDEFELTEISMLAGGFAPGGRIKQKHVDEFYILYGFIVPLTGWFSKPVLFSRYFFFRITPVKTKQVK